MSNDRCFVCNKRSPDNLPISILLGASSCPRHWMLSWVGVLICILIAMVGATLFLLDGIQGKKRILSIVVICGGPFLIIELVRSLKARRAQLHESQARDD